MDKAGPHGKWSTQVQATQREWFAELERAALAGRRDGVTIDLREHCVLWMSTQGCSASPAIVYGGVPDSNGSVRRASPEPFCLCRNASLHCWQGIGNNADGPFPARDRTPGGVPHNNHNSVQNEKKTAWCRPIGSVAPPPTAAP